jgi:hypothetical protein
MSVGTSSVHRVSLVPVRRNKFCDRLRSVECPGLRPLTECGCIRVFKPLLVTHIAACRGVGES